VVIQVWVRNPFGANLGVLRAEFQKSSDIRRVNSLAAKNVKIAVVFEVLFGVMDQVRFGERLFTCTIRQFGGDVFHRLPNQAVEIITHSFKQRLFTQPALKPRTLLLVVPSLATIREISNHGK
jgi:hypothetical protein